MISEKNRTLSKQGKVNKDPVFTFKCFTFLFVLNSFYCFCDLEEFLDIFLLLLNKCFFACFIPLCILIEFITTYFFFSLIFDLI